MINSKLQKKLGIIRYRPPSPVVDTEKKAKKFAIFTKNREEALIYNEKYLIGEFDYEKKLKVKNHLKFFISK